MRSRWLIVRSSVPLLPDEFRFWLAEPGPPLQSAIRETWQRTIAALEANPNSEDIARMISGGQRDFHYLVQLDSIILAPHVIEPMPHIAA